jgi:hypothetical protein
MLSKQARRPISFGLHALVARVDSLSPKRGDRQVLRANRDATAICPASRSDTRGLCRFEANCWRQCRIVIPGFAGEADL